MKEYVVIRWPAYPGHVKEFAHFDTKAEAEAAVKIFNATLAKEPAEFGYQEREKQ